MVEYDRIDVCVKELMLTKVMVHASESFVITGAFLR